MCLATVAPEAVPNARVVLLGGVGADGFRFFTSYESAKAAELAANPRAALVWFWPPDRQVRAQGRVHRLDPAASDAFWADRPREHQLAIWGTPQGRVIESSDVLEQGLAGARTSFANRDIPRPDTWGGYRLEPEWIEFWEQRPQRLHERVRHRRVDQDWVTERLAP
jgi:pyridoxamine 5'-phosphate oxidase